METRDYPGFGPHGDQIGFECSCRHSAMMAGIGYGDQSGYGYGRNNAMLPNKGAGYGLSFGPASCKVPKSGGDKDAKNPNR